MVDPRIRRLLDAYPSIFLACHRQHVRQDEDGKGITEHQASVLDHLDANRPTTLSKLAEHMGVGRSAMSITVKRLVRAGYIATRRDGDDGRRVGLTLTAAGAKVKEQNTILDPELVKRMFHPMRAAELEAALRGIECMAEYARVLLRQRKRGRDS
jgi:DNA-binding MarR family transcriptional regulator